MAASAAHARQSTRQSTRTTTTTSARTTAPTRTTSLTATSVLEQLVQLQAHQLNDLRQHLSDVLKTHRTIPQATSSSSTSRPTECLPGQPHVQLAHMYMYMCTYMKTPTRRRPGQQKWVPGFQGFMGGPRVPTLCTFLEALVETQ